MICYKGTKVKNPVDKLLLKEILKSEYSKLTPKPIYRKELADIIEIIEEFQLYYQFYIARNVTARMLRNYEFIYRADNSRTAIIKNQNHVWIIDIPEEGCLVTSNDSFFKKRALLSFEQN